MLNKSINEDQAPNLRKKPGYYESTFESVVIHCHTLFWLLTSMGHSN